MKAKVGSGSVSDPNGLREVAVAEACDWALAAHGRNVTKAEQDAMGAGANALLNVLIRKGVIVVESPKAMSKVGSAKLAASIAKSDGRRYGLSVHGGWYVGTEEQLRRIGVPDVT